MPRTLDKKSLEKLKQWEGLSLDAYRDSAALWTIGYGHTAACGHPIPQKGMKITKKQAEDILKNDLKHCEDTVERLVKVPLSNNQFAALVSFVYNVGADAFSKSTLLKKLNSGDYTSVPSELLKWVYCRGKISKGLVNRRTAESNLWIEGEAIASNSVIPEAQFERALSPLLWIPFAGFFSGLTELASSVTVLQWALALIIIVGFFCALFLLFQYMRERQL